MKIQVLNGRLRSDVPVEVSDKPYVIYCARPESHGGDVVVEIRMTRPKRGKGCNRSTERPMVAYDDVAPAPIWSTVPWPLQRAAQEDGK